MEDKETNSSQPDKIEQSNISFDTNQRQEMLRIARGAIRDYLATGTWQAEAPEDPELCQNLDVFVTLWSPGIRKQGAESLSNTQLRGCVGRIGANLPLYISLGESAVSAATKDPRFPPVSITELDEIQIEIALLSPFHIIDNLREIRIGDHGIMIEGFGRRGLLLPKVATRLNLNERSFYNALCDKAGLPYSCWPSSAVLYAFTTIDIHE